MKPTTAKEGYARYLKRSALKAIGKVDVLELADRGVPTSKIRIVAGWKRAASSARGQIHVRSSPLFSVSFRRLLELLNERGKDDFGEVSPTQHAFKNALELVVGAEWRLDRDTKSSPVVDSEGGISVTWRNGSKQIKLVCPSVSTSSPFIYHRSPEGSYVDKENVTGTGLASQLSWLFHDDQSNQPSK
jgi:hypothetical protein